MALRSAEIVQRPVERVTLGVPARDAIRAEVERQNASRVFLLAGGHLANETDEIDRIVSALAGTECLVHTGISAHVPKADVLKAVEVAGPFRPDLIVAVGGGSVTDATKVLSLALALNVGTREELNAICHAELAAPKWSGKLEGLKRRVICVPTTLSSGEYNMFAGALDEDTRHKIPFGHDSTVPAAIILDPSLTLHTPEWLWLSTGCRAVDHAVETLASDLSNPFANGLAESALRLLASGLPAVKARPDDLEGRLACQVGAWQASIPLTTGVPMGGSHAIGHALGGLGVPHGYTSCVMMPVIQKWNSSAIAERQQRISAALGDARGPLDQSLDRLIRSLGLPRTLDEVGISPTDIPQIARIAVDDPWAATNPRPLKTIREIEEILQMASGVP